MAAVLLSATSPRGGTPLLMGAHRCRRRGRRVRIGVVASLMGVAGGELLIPTLVLLFAVDIKLAGSLSLAVSLPTMLVAFARYSRDGSFAVLGGNRRFTLVMAAGSIIGPSSAASCSASFPEPCSCPRWPRSCSSRR